MVMLRLWAFVCGFCCLLELSNSRPYGVNRVKRNEVPASWSKCGTDDSFVVTELILPSVINIPGPVTFSLKGHVKEEINAPIQSQLEVMKKVFGFWITIPCKNKIGSCFYNDLCAELHHFTAKTCHFKQGEVSIQNATIKIPKPSIPRVMYAGDYKITIKLMSGKQHVTCLTMKFSLK
ncbi:ganglioside GM2 activator-like [Erpetoichthys calabaricus]|uniref:ganglioside GM2 activator-like n=1 Tax=Erpetoichthys calabaricus TaxID=27687 RepID=UPI002234921F|nr:ganglioside GM2 activator-like [Erpetoichthys calabaricus]